MRYNRLLIVDDDTNLRTVLLRAMHSRGYDPHAAPSGAAALAWLAQNECDLMILDMRLPGMDGLEVLAATRAQHPRLEVVLLTGHGTINSAVEAMQLGAFYYLTKPCSPDEIDVTLQRAMDRRALVERNTILRGGLAPPDLGTAFVGRSARFHEVMNLIDRVAPLDSTVLVAGETGVGKELVAKLLHNRSGRRDQPFVVVDCATLQEDLLQSELFGHEEGAYTGARHRKHGLFEVADTGTIFLDEIGDVSPSIQVKLLRVLESGTFRRLGSTQEIEVDVRVVAATNRDLASLVEQRRFRDDLLYRLNTIQITVPPLRERADDVAHLVAHYTELFNTRFGATKRFSVEAIDQLTQFRWPGNVRQLVHVVEQVIALTDREVIEPGDLPPAIRAAATPYLRRGSSDIVPLWEIERQYIEFVVARLEGHRAQAAAALGISERSLYRRLKEFEVE